MLFARAQQETNNMSSGCIAYNPEYTPAYNYVPSLAAGIVFSVIFLLAMVTHYAETIWTRKWFYVSFALGATGKLMYKAA